MTQGEVGRLQNSCKLPVFYSTDCSKSVVPVLVFPIVVVRFILRGDLFKVLSCLILFFFFQSFEHCGYLASTSERARAFIMFV